MQLSGIDLVTTLPAPMVVLSPIITPGNSIAPPPIHTLLPIVTGAVYDFQNWDLKDVNAFWGTT